MRKATKEIVLALLFPVLTLSLAVTSNAQDSGSNSPPPAAGNTIAPAKAKQLIAGRARETVMALKNGDMQRLSAIAHPTKGVRFTPYNYVEPKQDLVFRPAQLKGLMTSKKRYLWGEYDGTGDPIRLTFKKYYKRFIYDVDFAGLKQVSYNDSLSTNPNYDNAYETYANAIVVEYYFSGSKRYDGMDWRSLRLVFQRKGGAWYLVGIMHNEWTI
ncbi:MAG TPA: hypothetical protein VGC91_11665 [Pyrinomonadaceae bacterium]